MYTQKSMLMRLASLVTVLTLLLSTPAPAIVIAQETGAATTETTVVETPAEQSSAAPGIQTTSSTETPGPGENGQAGGPSENGQAGGDGTTGGADPVIEEGQGSDGTPSDVPAEVVTGDAQSTSDGTNVINTNNIDSGGDVTIDADNDASANNATEAQADTGANTASGGSGTASVSTGDAFAAGNAINVVNTNIINSSGMLLFLNLLFGGGYDFSTLDLSYFFGSNSTSTMNGCTLMGCDGADMSVSADNTATILNSVIVRAMTGVNEAQGEGGAYINTGDAFAAGNAVNLVNSNLINSNYLLVSLNSFGDVGDDIILPGASFFENLLQQQQQAVGGPLSVNTNNTAEVTDTTGAAADTGDNAATTGDGSASVDSGNAIASATSFNQVNSTLIGGTQIFMLFRIWGDFTGDITGLPSGMMWRETPLGIELVNRDGTAASTAALAGGGGSLTASTTNVANLTNNVDVFALTGDNKAHSASSTASIATGNAYAAANSVNMVNTNLIGRNWIFMIFNIFGNFSGNISFGRPNLWLGASAEAANPTLPGSDVTYHFTVSNRGDSDATNVKLTAEFLKDMLDFDGVEELDGKALWNLGTIKRNETREFVYRARAGIIPQGTSIAVPLSASISSNETDGNTADNTEKIDLVVYSPGNVSHTGPGRAVQTVDPKITMQKVSSIVATSAPAQIEYAIIINNEGGNAYDVKLSDKLIGPFGNYVGDQVWDLGTIKSGEEVRVEYIVAYGADIAPGFYKNTARLTGTKNNDVDQYATDMTPIEANNLIEIRPRGEVLGAAVEKALCEPYLVDTIKQSRTNSTKEVKKLQNFLVKLEGESVTETGRYDSPTVAAVKRFQSKHAAEILTPWGITAPTGNVYHTTKKKINELYCENTRSFELTQEQMDEIAKFRGGSKPYQAEQTAKGTVGGEPTLKDLAQPRRVEKAAIPVMNMILDLPTSTQEAGTSTIIRQTQSFLRSPASFLSSLLLGFAPLAEAFER